MKTLSLQEMQSSFEGLDDLLQQEGELIITQHGQPLARILPMRPARRMPSRAALRVQTPLLAVDSTTVVREDREGR